jgi:threonine dehydratase
MIDVPSYADVQAAARRIAPYAVRTPLVESPVLNDLTGGRVFLKLESLQRTGSFKFRGACNRILMIPEAERAKGVVAFSSGNHAQGVAAAAQLFGIPALIVMPADAPRAKVEGTRAYGAQITTYDRVRDDREAIAARFCAERGATLVRPYDDPGIMAGQGTIGLEIAEDAARFGVTLDAVATPCSGGGLVSGVALALKGAGVSAPVHSVEPENFDGMKRSLAAHARTAAPGTSEGGKLSIADALMAPAARRRWRRCWRASLRAAISRWSFPAAMPISPALPKRWPSIPTLRSAARSRERQRIGGSRFSPARVARRE